MHTPEWYEKQAVDKWLKQLGPDLVWSYKTMTFGYGPSGAPDYVLCLNGSMWGLEIKQPGKSPTIKQNERMRAVIRAGGHVAAGTAEMVIEAMTRWLATRGIVV